MSLRDRILTRPVAEAMTSPSAIVLAGLGAAVGIVAGGGPIAAVALAALGWAGRTAASIPRGPVAKPIDRRAVEGVWQQFVDEALAARERYESIVERMDAGPIRDRLEAMGERIDVFVRFSYDVAVHGQTLTDARADIDIARIGRELERLTGSHAPEPGSTTDQAARSLEAQLESARRMDETIRSTYERLVLLDARLDEAVTRATELSVSSAEPGALQPVERAVEDLVDELEAVRQAVRATA